MKKKIKRAAAFLLILAFLAGSLGCAVKEEKKEDPAKEQTSKEQKQGTKQAKAAEVKPVYPDLPKIPIEEDYIKKDGEADWEAYMRDWDKWRESRDKRVQAGVEVASHLQEFYHKTLPVFLGEAGGENRVYSPINVYLAMAMLTEVVDGETREQILNVLGASSLEEVRENAKALWLSNYSSDDAVTCLLANSLWLNENINFNEETLQTLAKEHFASAYSGECGSEEMNKKLQNWLDENTGGLLKDEAKGVQLTAETILALASTIYYKVSWQEKFEEFATKDDIFHGAKGDETVPFMVQTDFMNYYRGEGFTAVQLQTKESGPMTIILPDEGKTPEELMSSEEALKVMNGKAGWQNVRVQIHLPKFDVKSDMDLVSGFEKLGMSDVFNPEKADFTPLTEEEGVYVSQIKHAGRVKVDEDGVEAAAFTVVMVEGATYMPDEPIDLVIDRPFTFFLSGLDGSLLFSGVVNTMK